MGSVPGSLCLSTQPWEDSAILVLASGATLTIAPGALPPLASDVQEQTGLSLFIPGDF